MSFAKVDLRCIPKHIVRHIIFTDIGWQRAIRRTGQRRTVVAQRLIEIIVFLFHISREMIFKQQKEYHHIRLFRDLVFFAGLSIMLHNFFRICKIRIVLRHNAILIFTRQIHLIIQLLPFFAHTIQSHFFIQGAEFFRLLRFQHIVIFDGISNIEMRNIVGKRIVVNMFARLVRADGIQYLITVFIRVICHTADPIFCRVKHNLIAVPFHEIHISGNSTIGKDGLRNISGNMMFKSTWSCPRRCGLSIGHPCSLPRVHGSLIAQFFCFSMRAIQSVITILQQLPCCCRVCKDKEREHENFRVPERMVVISITLQTTGTDVHAAVVTRASNDQMINRKTNG